MQPSESVAAGGAGGRDDPMEEVGADMDRNLYQDVDVRRPCRPEQAQA
jgi:hypothetical protein